MEKKYDAVIFSGSSQGNLPLGWSISRGIGPYRLRTFAAKNNYKVKVIDFTEFMSKSELKQLIERYFNVGTLIYGVSTTFMSPQHAALLFDEDLISLARARAGKSLQIVSGGALAIARKSILVDWIITGYAEFGFLKLLDTLSSRSSTPKYEVDTDGIKTIQSNRDYPCLDVTDLSTEWLPEDFIQPHEALPIEIARGCIFKCSFCSYPLNGKKKLDYIRPSESIGRDIRNNFEKFGVNKYLFMDDTYNDSEFKMRMLHELFVRKTPKIKFCAYIKPELLATWPQHSDMLLESGLEGANLGFESFSNVTRALIKKGPNIEKIITCIENLQKKASNSIGISGNFIVGLPKESISSVEQTQSWLIKNTHIINSVTWRPLWILKKNILAYSSDIDLQPEKFGYQIISDKFIRPGVSYWTNEHMNFDIAKSLANRFMSEFESIRTFGGWDIGLMRNGGNCNVDDLVKNRTLWKDVDWNFINKGCVSFVKKYLNFQLSFE